LCLHVKSLQSGRVGFGQSPRLGSMQQDGLNKGRVESQFRIQTESPVSPYSVQLPYYEISETNGNPLVATLKPQSNGPSYTNTVIGTLVVDG